MAVLGPTNFQETLNSLDSATISLIVRSGVPKDVKRIFKILASHAAVLPLKDSTSLAAMHMQNKEDPSGITWTVLAPWTTGATTPTTGSPYLTDSVASAATQMAPAPEMFSTPGGVLSAHSFPTTGATTAGAATAAAGATTPAPPLRLANSAANSVAASFLNLAKSAAPQFGRP